MVWSIDSLALETTDAELARYEAACRSRIERALQEALAAATDTGCAPTLAAALRHAVFPGGARVRPLLCLMTARAAGEPDSELAVRAAVAIELLHCASLVHDDLPCFDDAPTRRGRPSVHAAFGEPAALLAGDALIVLAFEQLAQGGLVSPVKLSAMLRTLTRAAGAPSGIVAGQAWELEADVVLDDYHAAKTGALFEAAAAAGALAADADAEAFGRVGALLGLAYQVADDIADAAGRPNLGKPTGRDAALGRPSAVRSAGLSSAKHRAHRLLEQALAALPPCPDHALMARWMERLYNLALR